MLRQQPQTRPSSVSVQCGEDTMEVSVQRDLYGNGKLVKPSDLSLGVQQCKPSTESTDNMVIFQIGLQDCGNTAQECSKLVLKVWVVTPYGVQQVNRSGHDLNPWPEPSSRGHGNVSSKAIKPTWLPFSTTVSSEERLSFSLHLMAEDWSGPRSSSVFQLGDILYIEASVDIQNHIGLILFIDRCVATISPDASSSPNYDIITDNGCLVDGMQEDSSAAFMTPRVKPDNLRFTVDVFRFLGNDASLIYITCYLRAAAATQVPDSMNKACSYSKATNGWSAVEGPSNICQCCQTTGTCSNPNLMTGERTRFGRPRAFGKREALDEPHIEGGQSVTTLGPLLVIGPKQSDVALQMTKEESAPVELWVLVAVGCLSLLVVLVCAVSIWKSLKKPHNVLSVEK
ncbi:PREDICTED: zona pellucida sperm-binding protein 3-like [Nanorana parkeri]|uniref:zona pellucida sperm-binding protein 3-like n=1 Tax=Nanorana parkeri TaxID=125878 RepID=UPI000854BCD3|nr:PREDICTED: zona pellucida sperm-binding protein 3-like [Nanorana parkeri]